MAYYVYPVYVLASLIVLILSIIFIIYTIHFYKFVKSRVVFIKLEPEENNLNNWTFDLYPFTSSRIWKVFGYAIVCLPSTFQQASTILVCQCKVIKFKTTLPKSACDETKGLVTPALKKKTMMTKPTAVDEEKKYRNGNTTAIRNLLPPILSIEKSSVLNEDNSDDEEENFISEVEAKTPLTFCSENNKQKLSAYPESSSTLTVKSISPTPTPTKQCQDTTDRKTRRFPGNLIKTLRKDTMKSSSNSIERSLSRPLSTVINLEPDVNEHNISIMSIDNLCESQYFIIPEARPLQKLVVFNEPFNSSCPICLDDFELNEEIALLACHHGYHKDCLNKALRQNASCPYCKSESNVRTFRVSEEIPLLWQSMSRRNSSAVNV